MRLRRKRYLDELLDRLARLYIDHEPYFDTDEEPHILSVAEYYMLMMCLKTEGYGP